MDPAPDSLVTLAAGLAAGQLTSTGLVQQCLARIGRADPFLHAFSSLRAEAALAEAARADAERRDGRVRGPLHGIPVALKELFDLAGEPTTGGSRLYGESPATADAAVVRRLRAAGAVILGKTRMQELAFGGWGTHAVAGTPRNPRDLREHRVPGGSSSGAAVAVAAGLVPVAVATDTGGSIRIPAALCGVVGLKTTLGQIPRDGALPLAPSLDSVGPLARSVADAAVLYEVLLGRRLELSLPATPRIGVVPDGELGEVDAAVLAGFHRARDALAAAGATLEPVSFEAGFDALAERNGVLIAAEGWRCHGARIEARGGEMDPAVRVRFLAGRDVSPADYAAALRAQLDAQDRAHAFMADLDAVLTPTVPLTAIPVVAVDETRTPVNRFTRAVNYLGLCALALPAGLDSRGLPVSVQLIGGPHREGGLLALGSRLEGALGVLPPADLAGLP